jgi:hypothetical protein
MTYNFIDATFLALIEQDFFTNYDPINENEYL